MKVENRATRSSALCRRASVLFFLVASPWGCFENTKAEKDLINFTLPESVKAEAPTMEGHLQRMLVYNSGRFPIKPGFVFIDNGQLTMGVPDIKVSRLNMLHLAYSKENQLKWSGSLAHSVGKGANVFTADGYQIGLQALGEGLLLRFRDGETVFEEYFKADEDLEQSFGGKDGAPGLYINHYVFPADLVARGRPVRERKNRKPATGEPAQ